MMMDNRGFIETIIHPPLAPDQQGLHAEYSVHRLLDKRRRPYGHHLQLPTLQECHLC